MVELRCNNLTNYPFVERLYHMTMENQVGGFSTEIAVVPTISNGVAYASGDQLGGIQTLAVLSQQLKPIDAACQDKTVSYLMGLKILDKASQSAPLTIFFFKTIPTVASVDNGALSITTAEALKCIGHVSVAATDYKGPSAWKMADVGISNVLRSLKSDTDDGPLYAVVMITAAATYTSTTDLQFLYYFSQDLGNGKGV